MKINIVGNGSFGNFLHELLSEYFEISDLADSVILAVPLSAYHDVGSKYKGKHLINVCSVQKPSTDILSRYSKHVTSMHPLFGRRTPKEDRFTIVTRISQSFVCKEENDFLFLGNEMEFCAVFENSISVETHYMTPEEHDKIMARTHAAAVMGAKMLKGLVDGADHIPDYLQPNSFRLMKNFVKTLEDMPAGTMESIMANPYI